MPFQQVLSNIYVWTDTCNVYVIKDGSTALLIDLGDGSVLEHLQEIGVTQVEWILFTHHHREQCQGLDRLAGRGIKVAVPETERAFFETPLEFRKWRPTLGDAFSVYGASFVRPPTTAITPDLTFQKMDDFTWHGLEFWCVDTRGNSPGGMSYLLARREGWIAFSGDVMLDGSKFHNWFDSEWDYGFAKGLYALFSAAVTLDDFNPALMLPAHGPMVKDPRPQLKSYQDKLRELARHYVRGYELFTFSAAAQDRVSKPTTVPFIWKITPHLYKFKGPDFWPNFTLLMADNGHALVIDCGLFNKEFLDKALQRMHDRLGLKQIDAVIVTHMHGDHCQEAPHLREKWGAKLWTMDRVAPICQRPEDFDYAAPINTYQKGFERVEFDRLLADGETIYWEGYNLTVDWMPGQTEFALCLHGEIDGQQVVFTGDNIFASTTDPTQTGHEAVVARNSCILEEGYLYAAGVLHSLQPDIIIGGHSWVLEKPAALIARYRQGVLDLRAAYQSLSGTVDYRYLFDPYWVRAEPYRAVVEPGASVDIAVEIRNFLNQPQKHRIQIRTPAGIQAEPAILQGQLGAEARIKFPVRFTAEKNAAAGLKMITFDVTLNGQRQGELFDMLLHVGRPPAPVAKAAEPKTGEKKAY